MKIFFLVLFFLSLQARSQQSLLLIGGGVRPAMALKTWIETSAEEPKVMIITWASSIQAEVEDAIQRDFRNIQVTHFFSSRSINAQNKNQFLLDMKNCTHVFFSGGDQKRIMAVLQDQDVKKALSEAYWVRAIPVAGTSAGTAVQAEMMIQGDNLPLSPGLGFLPSSVVDMHFFKRHREERLRKAMSEVPAEFIGIGVDEDGALLLKRDPTTLVFNGQVLGDKKVLMIDPLINGVRHEHIRSEPIYTF